MKVWSDSITVEWKCDKCGKKITYLGCYINGRIFCPECARTVECNEK